MNSACSTDILTTSFTWLVSTLFVPQEIGAAKMMHGRKGKGESDKVLDTLLQISRGHRCHLN